jgi:hypothetical protein
VTTVTKLANAIGVFVAVIGVVIVIANLIGFTDVDWLRISPLFVIPCVILISNKHEKRK